MAIVRLQSETDRQRGVFYQFNTEDQPIGIGGMGKVYRGLCVYEQNGYTHPVAIKCMYDDLLANAYERARRESEIRLKNENLVEMLDFIETQDKSPLGEVRKHYHVVSELLTGVSLSDLLEGKTKDRNGVIFPFAVKMLQDYKNDPEHFAQFVVLNVLSGVMALHEAGYIHRDIDPSNIMLTADGHVKLIDFGIAKQMKNLTTGDKSFTIAGKFMGKPEYAAPELVLGDVDYQNQTTDVYAIGILLYQCITGHIPFQGARHEILEKQLKDRIPLHTIQNKALRDVVAKACEKKQNLRYQSAAQMRLALEDMKAPQEVSNKYVGYGVLAAVICFIAFVLTYSIVRNIQVNEQPSEYMDNENHQGHDAGRTLTSNGSASSKTQEVVGQINKKVAEADRLADQGIGRQDEDNYEKQMMEAYRLYGETRELVRSNPSANYPVADLDRKQKQLVQELERSIVDLTNVAEELEALEQYDVAEVFRNRVKTVVEFIEKQK